MPTTKRKTLYDPSTLAEVESRLAMLTPTTERRWGTMTPAQTMVHCAEMLRMSLGEINPPRALLGRIFGGMAKRAVIDRGAPMRRNSPTIASLRVKGTPDFDAERRRVIALVDRFSTGGPAACTTHPHPFFGELTPQEWSALNYQHLDHHLQQFGA